MPPGELRARWKLDGNLNDTDGVLPGTGDNIVFVDGPDNQLCGAALFNGVDSRLVVPDHPRLRLGSGDFTIACRLSPAGDMRNIFGDILAKFDPEHRTGFTLSMQGSAPAYSGMSDTPYLYFGVDDGYLGTIQDHGRPAVDNALVSTLAVHQDDLYCGIADAAAPDRAARVYRWRGDRQWEDCGRLGADPTVRSVMSLLVHRDQLYAGTGVWDWVKCFDRDTLTGPTHVFRYQGGAEWEDLGQIGHGTRVLCLASFDGALYAGIDAVGGGQCCRYDGQTWRACGSPDGRNLECLLPFGGALHAATHGRIYRYDGGAGWTRIGDEPHGITQIHSMAVFDGALIVGSWPQGYVLRYAGGDAWEIIGRLGLEPGRHPCNEVMDLLVHNGKLYAGVIPKAQLYRYESDGHWTLLHSLAGRPDWDEQAIESWCRITALTSFRGSLCAATGSCRGRTEDLDPDGLLGRVVSLQAGWMTACERRLDAAWLDVVAQRRGDRLSLYVNGERVSGSYRPGANPFHLDNACDLTIGRGPQGSFYGRIADVRIYAGAIDPAAA